jgi:hypothetical protein
MGQDISLRASLPADVVTLFTGHREDVLRSLLGSGEDGAYALADATVVDPGVLPRSRRFFGIHRLQPIATDG